MMLLPWGRPCSVKQSPEPQKSAVKHREACAKMDVYVSHVKNELKHIFNLVKREETQPADIVFPWRSCFQQQHILSTLSSCSDTQWVIMDCPMNCRHLTYDKYGFTLVLCNVNSSTLRISPLCNPGKTISHIQVLVISHIQVIVLAAVKSYLLQSSPASCATAFLWHSPATTFYGPAIFMPKIGKC
jgi:hypothetical protein